MRFIDDQKDSWGLRHLDVVFFGGEPLMNYEVVFRAAKALKEYEKNSISVTIDMITNGTLLTTERCRELAPYIDMMQVTLDGPKDVHDQRRPYRDGKDTYDDIVDNLETAIEYCKNIIVMPVVDGHNAPFIPELLRQLSDRGMHNKLAVGFSHTCLSQSAVAAGGCSGTVDLEIFRTITQLYTVAAQLGYSISKAFIKGPCLRSSANRFAVDEHLNVHKCPADLYGAHPDATINEAGRLDILRSNWYESVAFEPPCVASCIYGPICYGGCKWQAGGSTKRECHKEWLDLFIVDAIRTYVISHYEKKLQNHQV
ncbi:radical SAM protein [Dehalococcoidia bacterium]|nr:radical SAM protein [Dehalococcoidia bacterium]